MDRFVVDAFDVLDVATAKSSIKDVGKKVSACGLTVTRDQQGSASRVLLTDRPKVMLERWRYSTGWLRIIDSGVLKIES